MARLHVAVLELHRPIRPLLRCTKCHYLSRFIAYYYKAIFEWS